MLYKASLTKTKKEQDKRLKITKKKFNKKKLSKLW